MQSKIPRIVPDTETCEKLVHRAVTSLINEYEYHTVKHDVPVSLAVRVHILTTTYRDLCLAESRARKVT